MIFPKTTAWQKKLDSGLDVIVHEDHAHPVVSLMIWVETGSMHELPSVGSGLSHFLEHMVFKGTKSFTGEALVSRVEELGGAWNAYTTYDRTVYYIDGPAASASELLKVLFELVYLPTIPKEEFEPEREVIHREIAMGKDDPNSEAWESLMQSAYQKDTRRFPIIGDKSRFDAITHEEMVKYHETRYTFDNSFVVISGDVDSAALLKDLDMYASQVPTRRLLEVALPLEGGLSAPVVVQKEFPIPACKNTLMWYIPSAGHADTIALEILASVIGGGHSSILYQTLREKEELALNIYAWTWHPKGMGGMFAISSENISERFSDLNEALDHLISSIDLTQMHAALKRAKKQAQVAQISSLTTAAGRAKDLGSNWFESRNLDFTKIYLDKVSELTLDDLQRVANTYLKSSESVRFSLVPEGFKVSDSIISQQKKAGITPSLERLNNGLPLIIGKDSKLPTISFELVYKGGSVRESLETEGIGSLYSILLGKGTQSRTAKEFATALEDLGASLSCSNGNNTFIISGYCLKDDFEQLSQLTVEALTQPLFDKVQLEKERELMLAKIQESSKDPLRLAFWHARRELLAGSPYGLSKLGSEESVTNLTQDAILRYHKELITEGQATFTVYGDLCESSRAVIDQTFGTLTYQPIDYTLALPENRSGRYDITLDKEQAVVVISYLSAGLDSPDTQALELIQEYLSGMAGPLFAVLREEMSLAYYVSCSQFFGVNTGMFNLYIGVNPARKEEALAEMQKLFTQIVENGITEEDLDTVKVGVMAQHARQDQRHSAQAKAHGLNVLFGRSLEYREEERAKMITMTAQQVNKCLKKYFAEVEPVVTVVSPPLKNV